MRELVPPAVDCSTCGAALGEAMSYFYRSSGRAVCAGCVLGIIGQTFKVRHATSTENTMEMAPEPRVPEMMQVYEAGDQQWVAFCHICRSFGPSTRRRLDSEMWATSHAHWQHKIKPSEEKRSHDT
jgi:hypothetical protein